MLVTKGHQELSGMRLVDGDGDRWCNQLFVSCCWWTVDSVACSRLQQDREQ